MCLDVVGGVLEDGCRVWSCPVLGKGKGWGGTIIKVWSGWRCSFGDGKSGWGCSFDGGKDGWGVASMMGRLTLANVGFEGVARGDWGAHDPG